VLRSRLLAAAAAAAVAALLAPAASAQGWPGIFDPTPDQILAINLQMAPQDWDTIRRDTTNEVEVPATLTSNLDAGSYLVSVRRKSSRALPSESNPIKVGLKVDINEFVDQRWHDLEKLSLENGADSGVIEEGLAWNLHEQATGPGWYSAGHHPGLANWARVSINGAYIGVYASVEERDKQLLRNRARRIKNLTWLYEIDDRKGYAFEDAPDGEPHSPTYLTLCYSPFQPTSRKGPSSPCSTKPADDAAMYTQLNELIDMPAMLTECAVDAFTGNDDALCSHGKNYSFADWDSSLGYKRWYFPWDLDSVFTGSDSHIYGKRARKGLTQDAFQERILNHPQFRIEYNAILLGLTEPAGGSVPQGPLSEAAIHGFLDAVEAVVSQALADDPYAGVGDPAGYFDSIRDRVSARVLSVRTQAAANQPPPRS
jgi:hypothetical protein